MSSNEPDWLDTLLLTNLTVNHANDEDDQSSCPLTADAESNGVSHVPVADQSDAADAASRPLAADANNVVVVSASRHVTPPPRSSVSSGALPTRRYTPEECELFKVNPLYRIRSTSCPMMSSSETNFWTCPFVLKTKNSKLRLNGVKILSLQHPPLPNGCDDNNDKEAPDIIADNNHSEIVILREEDIASADNENRYDADLINNAPGGLGDLPNPWGGFPSTAAKDQAQNNEETNADSTAKFDEIWRCTVCQEIASPCYLDKYGMCIVCAQSSVGSALDLDKNGGTSGSHQNEDSLDNPILCKFCGCTFTSNTIKKHESRCQNSSFNKTFAKPRQLSSGPSAPKSFKRCRYCRSPLSDDFATDHEISCYMNPSIKRERDLARDQELSTSIEMFRQEPNPVPHNWSSISSGSNARAGLLRDTASASPVEFVSGIGFDFVEIPCEFCNDVIHAKNLFEHQVHVVDFLK